MNIDEEVEIIIKKLNNTLQIKYGVTLKDVGQWVKLNKTQTICDECNPMANPLCTKESQEACPFTRYNIIKGI